MSTKKPVLCYWDIRGLGQAIRYDACQVLLYTYNKSLEDSSEIHRDRVWRQAALMWTRARFWPKLLVGSEVQTGPWLSQSPLLYWRGYQGGVNILICIYNLTNVQLTQSNAILRFVARKYNKALLGRTEKEEAMADMMAEEAMDLRCLFYLTSNINIALGFSFQKCLDRTLLRSQFRQK